MSTSTQSPVRHEPPIWVVLLAIPLFGFSLLLALFSGIAGVSWIDSITASRDLTSSAPLFSGGTVTVDASSAAVKIEAGPAGQVSVEDSMQVRSATPGLAQAALQTLNRSAITPGDAGVTVAIPITRNFNLFAFELKRQVTVRMPAGAPLTLRGKAVAADIHDLTGTLDLGVSSGALRLKNVVVSGYDRISSTAGAVEFEGQLTSGSLDIEADSGAIGVLLPRGTNATYDVATNNGAIVIQPETGAPVVAAGSARSLTGVLGGGGSSSIRLRARSGAITIIVGPH